MRKLYSPEVGEELELPESINSVVSLTPSVTEVLLELGYGNKLVGVSSWCRVLAAVKGYEEVISKPIAGTYDSVVADVVNRADLVLLAGGIQRRLAKHLKELGVHYYVTNLPKSVWGIAEVIMQVAAVLGEATGGLRLAKKFSKKLQAVAGAVEPIKVYVELNLGGPVVPGLFTHIVTGLEVLGLNVLNKVVIKPYEYGSEALSISAELVRSADLVIYEDSRLEPDEESTVKRFKERCGVEPKNIIVLPVLTLTDFGPRFADELAKLAEMI